MSERTVEREKVKIRDFLIRNILNEKFLKSLDDDKEGKFVPVTLVLYFEQHEGKKQPVPIVLSHENSKEVEEKTIHVFCPDEKVLDKIVKNL